MRDLLEVVGPRMAFRYRVLFMNLWLFAPVVERVLGGLPAGSAAIRTTTAATVFHAGIKDNMLPSRARAIVNFRIYPGESVESVIAHVRETVADPRVQVEPLEKQREPSSVSPTDSESFDRLRRTIRQVYPDAIPAPYLIFGGADARHFRRLSSNVYGFAPVRLEGDDFKRIHGTNERIDIDHLLDGVRFYAQLMRNFAG